MKIKYRNIKIKIDIITRRSISHEILKKILQVEVNLPWMATQIYQKE
jgi:hypothetical protein